MWNLIISVIFYSIILPSWRTGLRAARRTSGHAASVIVRKPLDLPPAVDRAFVKDMRAFFAEKTRYKQDEIALRQLHALKEHQGPRDKKLRLSDVTDMFYQMRDDI
jgi:hypothetical protein